MIKINNITYDINLKDIIENLRYQLNYDNNIFLFKDIKELPEDLMVTCPFHKEGQEKKPSCGLRKLDGWCHCFTCGASYSLSEMISRCYGKNDFGQYGMKWLQDNYLYQYEQSRNINVDLKRNKIAVPERSYVGALELDSYRYYHPYMFKRKMNEEVIEKFDVGYDKNTDCITFPVRDKNGNCLFIARRSVKGKYFNYPNDVEKPIYGVYELPKNCQEVILCESMINAITCYVYGKPALALNGTGTSKQIEELKKLPIRKYILALDPDNAGRRGEEKIKQALSKTKVVTKYIIPEGRDINDLSKEEFDSLEEIL